MDFKTHSMTFDRISLTKYVLLSLLCAVCFAPQAQAVISCKQQMKELSELSKASEANWPKEEKKLTFTLNTGLPNQKVQVATSISGWEANLFDLKEITPGQYSFALPSPWTDAIAYKFIVDGKWQVDPENPEQIPDNMGGYNSVARTHFKDDPLLVNVPEIPWKETKVVLKDEGGKSRDIFILSPPKVAGKKRVILYFQDGADLDSRNPFDNWVANISARPDMPEVTAVLISASTGDGAREKEYNMSDSYLRFVTETVVPTVERQLGGGFSANRRGIVGESMGGLMAFYAGIKKPDTFGIVVSQSGSFWYDGLAILQRMTPSTHPEQQIYLSAGIFESKDKIINGNHQTVTRARELDYPIVYEEFPTQHDWRSWLNELTRIAEVLFTPKKSETTP